MVGVSVKERISEASKTTKTDFEELYIAVRQHEQKIYTDSQLRLLPGFATPSEEWDIRKKSSGRLLAYLQKKRRSLNILEIGCGNGWLTAKLAGIPNSQVTGLDINQTEIDQARRVFKKANLEFICDGFTGDAYMVPQFDVIVLAASLQYFPSVAMVLQQAVNLLNYGGEIHIIDTPFYTPMDADKAAGRCRDYYTNMGIPQMAEHYFHHDISEFLSFEYQVMFNPGNILNRVFKKDPFYWIAIYK